jgi:hypothetical protein
MNAIPGTVSTYLHDHAPKGRLIGYWLDVNREYNVLILYRRDGEFRFSVGAFPAVVGHWGHELTGGDYSLEETGRQLDYGFWNADEALKDRVRTLIARLEQHLEADDILAECRAVCDPQGRFDPSEPAGPRRGPDLRHEAQFRVVSALANALAGEDPALAEASARKLASMGITENDGPLFARNALLTFRKRRGGCRTSP